MAKKSLLFGSILWALVVPALTYGCSLCGSLLNRYTLREEMQQAKMVLYGFIANPKPALGGNPSGGQTDFHILGTIKPHPAQSKRNPLVLSRYLPILDPKSPPKYVVFFEIVEGKWDPFMGKPVQSKEIIRYLKGVETLKNKSPVDKLLYYFPYLDYEDPTIAQDAFLEFAKARDEDIGQVAKQLNPAPLRILLKDPEAGSEQRSLLAFLLGGAGNDADAKWLRAAILDSDSKITRGALDGFLTGYIQMNPQEGWNLVHTVLRDKNRDFSDRFNAFHVIRFYQNWQPKKHQKAILSAMQTALNDREISDLAIDALRRYEIWDLTDQVLALYNHPHHTAPITQRSIIRYALSCEEVVPAAKAFMQKRRKVEPKIVAELEEILKLEKMFSGN